jgi:hypothetical protein
MNDNADPESAGRTLGTPAGQVTVPAGKTVPATDTTARKDSPVIPLPPRRLSWRTRLTTTYNDDDMFRWVVNTGGIVAVILAIVFVICAFGIHRQWKDALNILIGAASPTSVPGVHYVFTATIAIIGYIIVPAFIGVVVTTLAAAMAVRQPKRNR